MSGEAWKGTHIDFAGPEYVIIAGGASWLFEQHPYFGPVPLTPWGDPSEYPAEDSPFWEAVEAWDRQGRRLSGFHCVWEPALTALEVTP